MVAHRMAGSRETVRRAAALLVAAAVVAACDGGSRGDAEPRATPPAADPLAGRIGPTDDLAAAATALAAGDQVFLGHAMLTPLAAEIGGTRTAAERVPLRYRYARELIRVGDLDAAIGELDAAIDEASSSPPLTAALGPLYRVRAIAWLRRAENENCVARNNRDCCVFPLRDGGVHALAEPARRARADLLEARRLGEDPLALRWLLNLTAMALGDHPDAVDPRDRIDPSVFASEDDIGRFENVAQAAGVAALNLCGGCVVEDFDRDGVLDVFTTTYDPAEHALLYRGLGGLSFEDRSAAAGMTGQLGGLNCIGGDYDGDGDVDLLVLRGAWLLDDGQLRNSLLENRGDGTFGDVTRSAGLADPARPTQAACFGDFDDDGHLDLYVGNESRPDEHPVGDYPGQLFRNLGDRTFEDVAAAAGVTNDRYCKGVAAGDYDNDGDLDLYVSNATENRLYRNDGGLRFVDVAAEKSVLGPQGISFACWFFDFDENGWLDIFCAGYDADLRDVAADALGIPAAGARPVLYRNEDARFEDVAPSLGLDHVWLPMGANFADLDHDGWLDVYLATGEPDLEALVPNVALRNDEGRRFLDVTTSSGLGHLQKGHGVAFADLDEDGDQDLFHQLGGFLPVDEYPNALFRNPGNDNHHLYVRLRGVRANRFGVGARVTVTVERPDGSTRSLHRAMGIQSSFGGSPLRLEIGLGDAVAIRAVEVRWPGPEGRVQRVEGPVLDTSIEITESTPGR